MKQTSTILMIALLLASGIAKAEDKVGLVDVQKVVQTSDAGKKAKADLEVALSVKKKDLQDQEDSLKRMQEDLKSKESSMSDSAKKEKTEQLQKKYAEYQANIQKSQADLQSKENELAEPILKKVRAIIAKIAHSKKYTLVLEKNENQALFFLPKNDLTEQVMAEMNETKDSKESKK
jgi:outer membrane protein